MRATPHFAQIVGQYLGKPFAQITCMTLVAGIYTDMGFDFPREYGELTLGNYMQYFREDPAGTVARMEALFATLGTAVGPHSLRVRDLLVVEHPGGVRFPAVYLGGQTAVASFEQGGVTVFGLDTRNRVVLARRLVGEVA